MSFAIEILGYGGAIPAGVSFAIVCLFWRFAAERVAARYAAAVGFAAAFFVGYALLPSWAALKVSLYWHWLPYLGAVAMVLGPIALAEGVRPAERWLVQLLLALLAAWLLVPTWADLQPSRPIYIALLASYLLVLTVLLDPLIARLRGPLILALLSLVAGATAVLLAVFASIKFGQLAGIASAALAGCAVAAWWSGRESAARGLLPAFMVLVGGVAFAGYVYPEPPLTGMMLLPAAPLALWVFCCGPLARLRGLSAAITQTVVVLVPIVIALVLLILAEQAGDQAGAGY